MAPIDIVLQKGHSSYQKYYKNGTQHKWHLKKMAFHNYIIGFLTYYQHPVNRTYLQLDTGE